MTQGDVLGIVLTFLYIFSLLLVVELIRKWRHYPIEFTRKAIHIGVGTWIWATLVLFDHWQILLIPPAIFVVLNALFLRFRVFKAMDPVDDATPGSVYHPLSILLLLASFHQGWEQGFPRGHEYLAMVGIMSMTYGDAFAAIIGKTFGKHIYHTFGEGKRSLEGSLGGAIVTFIVVTITLLILSPLSFPAILLAALTSAISEMLLEAISPWGLDNLIVPLGVTAILFLLKF